MDDGVSPLLEPLERRRGSILNYIRKNLWLVALIVICTTIGFFLITSVDMPNIYIQQLYIPALDLSENSTAAVAPVNPTLFFDLKFENPMESHSISYGEGDITFFYGSGRRLRVANYTVEGFILDEGKTAYRRDVVETRGVPWDAAFGEVSGGSAAVFGVEMAVRVRFRSWILFSSKRRLRVASDVEVSASGRKLQSEAVRLMTSATNRRRRHQYPALTFVVVSVLLVLVM